MANTYKHSNGHRVFRKGNGQFRKTTLADMGIMDANEKGVVYICNVCEREFVPVVHSGKCCGVEDKRVKEIIYTDEQKEIIGMIEEVRRRPFINRQMLEQIQELERQLSASKNTK